MIIALFSTRSANISLLSEAFISKAKSESNYKRIIRFLNWVPMTVKLKCKLGNLILDILEIRGKKIHIAMDRTD